MKTFQCSQCAHLEMDNASDEIFTTCPANPDPRYRSKCDREACLEYFKPLPSDKQWHAKFSWEK